MRHLHTVLNPTVALFYKSPGPNMGNLVHFQNKMTNAQGGMGTLGIDLATVFDAILTSRQMREKLQCLYENLISNNFCRTAVLKKISIVNKSFTPKDSTKQN